jgi:hypothetical protein
VGTVHDRQCAHGLMSGVEYAGRLNEDGVYVAPETEIEAEEEY